MYKMKKEEKLSYTIQEYAVIGELRKQPACYQQFQMLDHGWQKRFLDFSVGKKTLPLTYDPFFKWMFHPDIHPGRLSGLLSSLLGDVVKVVGVLPASENVFVKEALLVMDILVELWDGSLANVEIQKIPFFFPAERMSCYSADLLLRQYSRVKGKRGKCFRYSDIKKVYTIVIFEKSSRTFHEKEKIYIHRGRTEFDTGLKLEFLQEYCLVALDVFREIPYAEHTKEREAWLGLLATETIEEALLLAERFPWTIDIYKEMADYMKRPKEVLNMFSEALRILDRNTTQYMIEVQQEQIEEQKQQIEEQKQQIEMLLAEKQELERLYKCLAKKEES